MKQDNWEKEFDDKFTYKPSGRWWTPEYGRDTPTPKEIKEFIRKVCKQTVLEEFKKTKI